MELRKNCFRSRTSNFNWQLYYDLAEPKFIPAGTTFLVEGAYDNSAMNPNNPDPDATVVYGAMDSAEEMFGARVLLKVAVSDDPSATPGSVKLPGDGEVESRDTQ